MKKQKEIIRQYEISPRASSGVFVLNMKDEKPNDDHDVSEPHRDEHFLLVLATGGSFRLRLDFENLELTQPSLMCVSPEQVHQIIEIKNASGWIISFDPAVVDEQILQLLEARMREPITLDNESNFYQQCCNFMSLIENVQRSSVSESYRNRSIHDLLNAMISFIVGEIITSLSSKKTAENRSIVIRDDFYQLLKQHYKTWKQPSQYASKLAISVSHLNDTIKSLTGVPVSVHIQQAAILEAKRLLYFTDKSIKEIGPEVGYDEPVYFGKLFKKVTNLTPGQFRQQFRD